MARHRPGEGICTPLMAGQEGNDKMTSLVHGDHAGVGRLVLDIRRDQTGHRAGRQEKNQVIVMGKQSFNLRGERPLIRRFPAVLGRTMMGRAVQPARSELLTQLFRLREAVAGHGNDSGTRCR